MGIVGPKIGRLARRPTFQERFEYAAFRIAQFLVAPLSLRQRSALAGWLGKRVGMLLPLVRRIDKNLTARRPHIGSNERRAIARGILDNFARTAVEYSRLTDLFAAAPSFQIEGLENLIAAREMADGRMVVASAHYGNWEAVRAAAFLHQTPLAMVYRPFNNPLIERDWSAFVRSVGSPAFPKGLAGARLMLKHVSQDGGCMILVDQRLGGAPLLDFMGAPAETSLAPAQLALRTGTPLLPAMARRTQDGFHVVFEEPITPAAPDAMMAAVNRRIGQWVDDAPDQWFWLHRRWRVRDIGRRSRKFDTPPQSIESDPASHS